MDEDYALEQIGHANAERDAWKETAAQHCRNEQYYRDLVVRIGKLFGEQAYVSDDGSKQEDVLCAKVPELVEKLIGDLDYQKRSHDGLLETHKSLLRRLCIIEKLLEPWSETSGECWQCNCARRGVQHTNGPCRCSPEWKEFRRAT